MGRRRPVHHRQSAALPTDLGEQASVGESHRRIADPGLVVQKFGGSSVADLESIRRVARRVAETSEAGHRVVVVISANASTAPSQFRHSSGLRPDRTVGT